MIYTIIENIVYTSINNPEMSLEINKSYKFSILDYKKYVLFRIYIL